MGGHNEEVSLVGTKGMTNHPRRLWESRGEKRKGENKEKRREKSKKMGQVLTKRGGRGRKNP